MSTRWAMKSTMLTMQQAILRTSKTKRGNRFAEVRPIRHIRHPDCFRKSSIIILLAVTFACQSCSSVYNSFSKKSPSSFYNATVFINGAYWKQYADETDKTIYISIHKLQCQKDCKIFSRKYILRGACIYSSIIWVGDEEVKVILRDYGDKQVAPYFKSDATSAQALAAFHIGTFEFQLNKESSQFEGKRMTSKWYVP